MSNLNKIVEVYHRINKLKMKAGAAPNDEKTGFIDPKAIKKAQNYIDNQEESYGKEIEAILVKLDSTWDDLKTVKDDKKIPGLVDKLQNFANNIKDMAATYQYKLMVHFSESLRDFCDKLDVKKDSHKIIVQAHIDVMSIVYHENIKDDGGPHAKELKMIVAKAIEEHSK